MTNFRERTAYHLLAICVVMIWGVTFVNTKILLLHGLRAEEIFFLRFLLSYACIWFVSPKKIFAHNWKDEFVMLVLGIAGGSMYFFSENVAVQLSHTNNVAFLVCLAPLLTSLLSLVFNIKVNISKYFWAGTILAVFGAGMIIFNGSFVLQLNPLGDFLALTAAFSWALYSVVIRKVSSRYSAAFINRKLFFYGLLTILPVFAVRPWQVNISQLLQPVVWSNLLFLGIISSFICFIAWSVSIKKIGVVSTSNYVYLSPISTLVVSTLVLHEPLTVISVLGCFSILVGVFLAQKNQ